MTYKNTIEEQQQRVAILTTLEAVAYANRLSKRLKCDDCTDEERENILELLVRLNERVSFLKITLEAPNYCRLGQGYFSGSNESCK